MMFLQPGSEPDNRRHRQALRRLRVKIILSRLVIGFERLWVRLWLPLGVGCFFVLVSLAGLWSSLPYGVHSALLFLFGALFLLSLWPLIRLPWPSEQDALRRLEINSGLPHRPASAYLDTLFQEGATKKIPQDMNTLWQTHRDRMIGSLKAMKVGGPRPRTYRHDPYALRAVLLIVVVLAFLFASEERHDRLASAFHLPSNLLSTDIRIDAWITPPLYTAKAPFMLLDGALPLGTDHSEARIFEVPEKSHLVIRIQGAQKERFSVVVKQAGQPTSKILAKAPQVLENVASSGEADAEAPDHNIADYQMTLKRPASVYLRDRSRSIFSWNFNIRKDRPPSISLRGPLVRTERGTLNLKYRVSDDYGVASAHVRFDRRLPAKKKPGENHETRKSEKQKNGPHLISLAEPPVRPLLLPRTNTREANDKSFIDLTAHPWAGLAVWMTLIADDQAGQEGRSEPKKIILPERKFMDPLARALIQQRRKLVRDPGTRLEIVEALDALSVQPEPLPKSYSIYLGLRTMRWRLHYNSERTSLLSVVSGLWELALKIEDGDLSRAERALREAQDKLSQMLKNNAPEDDIKRQIEALKEAINKFLQGLSKASQKAFANRNFLEDTQAQRITRQDIQQIMKDIEDLAKMGSKDRAQLMLGQLRELLENLRSGSQRQNPQAGKMQNMLEGLGKLIERQQRLLDDSFRAQQEKPEDPEAQEREAGQPQEGERQGQGVFSELSKRQLSLKDTLHDLLGQLEAGGISAPDTFKESERAMGRAHAELREGALEEALQSQNLALDRLRRGAHALARQMQKRGVFQAGPSGVRDPFGRPYRRKGASFGDRVKVPDKIERQRAREILEELREKLGEPKRPKIELDYIERLLHRF